MFGWLGPISDLVSDVRSFVQGTLGRGAEEGFSWPAMTDALAWGGLERFPEELHRDFEQHVLQKVVTGEIASLRSDYLIPESLHVETERLLPHKYAYEVEIAQWDREGNRTTSPYYVGSDKRLTRDEILDVADQEAQNSPDEGAVSYSVEGVVGSWRRSG